MTTETIVQEVVTRFRADPRHASAALTGLEKQTRRINAALRAARIAEERRFQITQKQAKALQRQRIAQAKLNKLKKEARREEQRRLAIQRDRLALQRRALRTVGRGGRFAGRVAGGAARGLGLGVGVGAVFGLGSLLGAGVEREQTELALASLFVSAEKVTGGVIDFDQALVAARESIEQLRAEAIRSPGSLNGMVNAFREIAIFARQAGASYNDIIRLSGTIGAREALNPSQKGIIARDVRQILSGRFSVAQIQTPQLQDVGARAARLVRTGRRQQGLALITEALRLSEKERMAFEKSFSGIFETLKDEVTELAIVASTPLLADLKDTMSIWISFIRDNPAEVKRWVTSVTADIGNVLEAIGDVATGFADIIGFVKDGVNGIKALFSFGGSGPDTSSSEAKRQASLDPTIPPDMRKTLAVEARMAALDEAFDDLEPFEQEFLSPFRKRLRDDLEKEKRQIRFDAARRRDLARAAARRGTSVDDLFNGKPNRTGRTHIDARNARISIKQEIRTDNPSRLAAGAVVGAFMAVSRRPLSGRFGLGSVPLANGSR